MSLFAKKMKEKTYKVGYFYVSVSDKMVRFRDLKNIWSMEFASNTRPYALVTYLIAADEIENLERLAFVLFTANTRAMCEPNFLKALSELETNIPAEVNETSKEENEEALREVQAMYEQTEEAVEKHIRASQKNGN